MAENSTENLTKSGNGQGNGKKIVIALSSLILLGLVAAGVFLKWGTQLGLVATSEQTAAPTETAQTETVSEGDSAVTPSNDKATLDFSTDNSGLSKAVVTIETVHGTIRFRFYSGSGDAPNTSRRIAELIQAGFYTGLTFHRVVPNFVVQGGDPVGNGTGGSGQKQKAEFNSRKHIAGTVAMARAADPNSADSQFYIATATVPHLDGGYTVFGQVIEGMDVVRQIQVGDKMISVKVE